MTRTSRARLAIVSLAALAASPFSSISAAFGIDATPRNNSGATGGSALRIEPEGGGYRVSGKGFTLNISSTGSFEGLSMGGHPVIDRGYVEVRDRTWHVKLSPRPEQAKAQPPARDGTGAWFRFNDEIDDTGTGIRLGILEKVLVRPEGRVELTLTFLPRASFTAQRVSWNTELSAERYGGTAYAWAAAVPRDLSAGVSPAQSSAADRLAQSARFPGAMAPDPHMLRDFRWVRLHPAGGPLLMSFRVAGPQPVENVLEDLRYWNDPRFWVADAAPYPRQNGDVSLPLTAQPGDDRTIEITFDLRPAQGD